MVSSTIPAAICAKAPTTGVSARPDAGPKKRGGNARLYIATGIVAAVFGTYEYFKRFRDEVLERLWEKARTAWQERRQRAREGVATTKSRVEDAAHGISELNYGDDTEDVTERKFDETRSDVEVGDEGQSVAGDLKERPDTLVKDGEEKDDDARDSAEGGVQETHGDLEQAGREAKEGGHNLKGQEKSKSEEGEKKVDVQGRLNKSL